MALSLAPMSPEWADVVATWGDAALPCRTSSSRLLGADHLAILEDGALVGLACLGEAAIRDDGAAPPGDATALWLVVAPSRRGRRLATRAAELVFETLRLAGHVRLWADVPLDDDAAGRLARRLGFQRDAADELAGRGRASLSLELLA